MPLVTRRKESNEGRIVIIKPNDIYKATGILSTRRAYMLERPDPEFPRRVKVGPRSTGWLEKEILGWLRNNRMESRYEGDQDE